MNKKELQERMTTFAVRIIRMVDSLPSTISGKAVARQIIRSGTSPSANYRAACIAKSDKDFINKLKMVEEELDENGALARYHYAKRDGESVTDSNLISRM